MIFFNRHKKTGKDIGKSVRQTVLQAFQIYGKEPPKSVFLNEYIYGFINASVTNLMVYVFGGKDWNNQKKGECIAEAFKAIDILLYEYHLQQAANPERFKDLPKRSKDFKKGMDDATTLVGVSYGFLKPDDPDPILKKAKKIAAATGDLLPGSTNNSKLGGAVLTLTLHDYIKKTFIK
tara:strand:- start:130 stop:663 length:534 start_codon:yes stop_codon:yes gene_type:complete